MSVITMAAESTTLILNGDVISELAEGDYITIAPVNPRTSHQNSSNGGVNINSRVDADVHDLTVRVQDKGFNDATLNGYAKQEIPVIISGSLKENFTRDNTEAVESWSLQNGSITSGATVTKNNTDGNALSEYVIRFRTAKRNL